MSFWESIQYLTIEGIFLFFKILLKIDIQYVMMPSFSLIYSSGNPKVLFQTP